MNYLSVVIGICGILSAVYVLYYAITCFWGILFKKQHHYQNHEPLVKIAAIIPARNEAGVVGNLVKSLLSQEYPRELFEVYVVPNNCTDNTRSAAQAAGASILDIDTPVHTKGDVLRSAFSRLCATEKYDVYCVFDADNLVTPDFFIEVNNTLLSGCHVAQSFRDVKNPYDNWVSGSMAVFYWFMSRCFNKSRSLLGLSCHLNGTGFMVSNEVIKKIGWDTYTLTEDLEFSALCALNGYKIGWIPKARVYDEQTNSFKSSCVQRRRWTSGSLQCMRRYTNRLLAKHITSSIDMALLFAGNLLCIIGLIQGIGTAIYLLPSLISNPWRIIAMLALVEALSYLVCCATAALMYKAEGRLNRKSLPGIFGFPLFMITWFPINIVAIITPPPGWKEIKHIRSTETPDN